jgi:aldehyde:ferredoxin oxidoreductase
MGAKRLKAVVVRGDDRPPVADPQAVTRRARSLARRALGEATAKYREVGTAGNLSAFARVGALPTYNFRGDSPAGFDRLDPETLMRAREHGQNACAACNIGCEHVYRVEGGGSVRVEYESLFALGPLCGIDEPDGVLEASRRCDQLGLDTISAGGTIAFAMECGERGLLPGAPRFGDAKGVLSLLGDIAQRRGVGALLSEGSRRAAQVIGHDSLDFAPQVKGLELPGYEPRALQTMALGFAVGTRGADHNRSGAYELDFSTEVDRFHGDDRAAALAVEPELRAALMDSLILCKFVRHAIDDLFAESTTILREVVGWDIGVDELRRAASRIIDLKKAFNIREGWTPADDTLPRRLLEQPLPEGAAAGARLSPGRLARMIRAYNIARGWTEEGYLRADASGDLGLDVCLPERPVSPCRSPKLAGSAV